MTYLESPEAFFERIDIDDPAAVDKWAERLDSTSEQVMEAGDRIGPLAANVEMDLKGSRSSTNADRNEAADDAS